MGVTVRSLKILQELLHLDWLLGTGQDFCWFQAKGERPAPACARQGMKARPACCLPLVISLLGSETHPVYTQGLLLTLVIGLKVSISLKKPFMFHKRRGFACGYPKDLEGCRP